MFELFFQSEKQLADYLLGSNRHYTILDDSPKNKLSAYIIQKHGDFDITNVQQIMSKGPPYIFEQQTFKDCGNAKNLLANIKHISNTIITYSCTNKEIYDILTVSKKTIKIPYTDYSFRTAFFIVNDSI